LQFSVTEDDIEAARYIPAEVKRQVRQKCGFGCIFCGSPVFQYDHLRDFAVVREHDPSNINLLCPTHHMAKTSGRLSSEAVATRANNPVNLSSDRSITGMPLELCGATVTFDIGSNVFVGESSSSTDEFSAVQLSDRPMISASWREGWMLLDMTLTDGSGTPVITVEKGELRTSTAIWDFELVGRRLTVRAGPRKITTSLILADGGLTIDRGFLIHGPLAVKIQPDSINLGRVAVATILGVPKTFIPGSTFAGGFSSGCRTGVQYG
jgi:trigger factor